MRTVQKFLVFLFLLTSFSFVGCADQPTTDQIVAYKQEKLQQEIEKQAELPNITRGTELKQLNYIYEMRDNTNLITYSYTMSSLTGKWHFAFKSMGYGIPYDTQRSAPTKAGKIGNYTYVQHQVPQSEPNGLYPGHSNGTWIFKISRETGKVGLSKIEDNINTFDEKMPCDNPQDYY